MKIYSFKERKPRHNEHIIVFSSETPYHQEEYFDLHLKRVKVIYPFIRHPEIYKEEYFIFYDLNEQEVKFNKVCDSHYFIIDEFYEECGYVKEGKFYKRN